MSNGSRTRSTSDHFVDTCAHAERFKVAADESNGSRTWFNDTIVHDRRVQVTTGQCLVCPRHDQMNEQEYVLILYTKKRTKHNLLPRRRSL